jgi:hypothetical protein
MSRELKTIACNGDMIRGDIFEHVDEKEIYHLRFRIDEMTGQNVSGKPENKKVRIRYTLDQLREMHEELGDVIKRMEQEL